MPGITWTIPYRLFIDNPETVVLGTINSWGAVLA